MKREVIRDTNGWITGYDGKLVLRIHKLQDSKPSNRPFYAINLKGCNGSGKSTVPITMIKDDHEAHKPNWVYLTLSKADKKPVATYCPSYDTVILGTYLTACGGCDSIGDTQMVKTLLARLWRKSVHVVFEGVIVGDIKSTFYELMKDFNTVHPREVSFCFMGTKYKECLRRIQHRNGGKAINEGMVKAKYINSCKHLQYYLEQGDVDCKVLRTTGTPREVFARFRGLYPNLGPSF